MTNDLTNGRPLKLILRFAAPMMIGAAFQQLYNVADMIIVGRVIGSRAFAAIGATGSATFFVLALLFGISMGFTAVASQYFGAKNIVMLRKTFVGAIYISIAGVLALSAAGFLGAEPLMRLLMTPDDIIKDSVLYLQICIGFGSVGIIMFNGAAAILRAVGDSRTPLIFLIIASGLSVLFSLLFVLGFGMGVAGVAVATVIAQTLSGIACIVYMYKRFDVFRLTKSDFSPDIKTISAILKIGLPIGAQSLLLSIGDMTITGVANTFGTDVVAAFAAGNRIWQFAMMFCANLASAYAVFAGQNLGAGKIKRIRQGFRETVIIMTSLSVIMAALVFLFGDHLVRFFISDADAHIDAVIAIARSNMRTYASFYLFLGLIWLYNYTLRGMGDILIPFISGLSELIVKVSMSVILSRNFGYIGLWFAMPLAWVIGLIPSAIRFHTGGWQKLSRKFEEKVEPEQIDVS
jgi:putative MATE family efflux protein